MYSFIEITLSVVFLSLNIVKYCLAKKPLVKALAAGNTILLLVVVILITLQLTGVIPPYVETLKSCAQSASSSGVTLDCASLEQRLSIWGVLTISLLGLVAICTIVAWVQDTNKDNRKK